MSLLKLLNQLITNKWLFGGIFEVIKRHQDHYEVKLSEKYESLIGRMMVNFDNFRSRHANLENQFNKMTISQILKEKPRYGIYTV